MPSVNIHEAKTRFSRLVEAAASGETIIVAKAGHPVAKLVGLHAAESPPRVGFLAGQAHIPDDFDSMGGTEIRALFEGHR